MESIHFDPSGDNLSVASVGRLVDSKYFKIDKGHQARNCEVLLSPGKMKMIMIMSGFGTIVCGGRTVDFKAGETMLIPAAYGGVMRFSAETEYLTTTI